MNNNNNEAKNEKFREYLKTHNLDNLPITDLDDIYNKNFVTKDYSDKFEGNKICHIDERDIKYGPSSVKNYFYLVDTTKNPFDNVKEYSKNETATAEKIVFSEPTNTFSDGNQMTSDDIIKYVPQTLPIDGDDCTFNLTMMTIDGEPKFVVTYERTTDGWPCKSFYASTLRYVLNDVALYAAEECCLNEINRLYGKQ